jgi:hypothetical protein
MKDYVEEWLKQALLKITKEDQLGIVETDQPTATKNNIKGTTSNK